MAGNPKLNDAQLARANQLLEEIRGLLSVEAGGDDDTYFALRRKVAKELTYDERGKPGHRKRLKKRLMKLQRGLCVECHGELPARGAVLDRNQAKFGYTEDNVELIHPACDQARQAAKGYSD